MKGWELYNGCWIPTCAPHESPDLSPVKSGAIWREGGWLARWTTDFDCGYDTGWYFIIKDKPFELSQVESKARNRIRRGLKTFTTRLINGVEFYREINEIRNSAYAQYPAKYRPHATLEQELEGMRRYRGKLIGAFHHETGKLCGFASANRHQSADGHGYYSFSELKVLPEYERDNINAALVYGRLDCIKEDLANGWYGCSGETNVLHETSYQTYLVEKFAFKKVYCHLHLAYNPKIRWIIKLLFPFRALLRLSKNKMICKICAVLKMEEVARACN